jgi:hypothetical protein
MDAEGGGAVCVRLPSKTKSNGPDRVALSPLLVPWVYTTQYFTGQKPLSYFQHLISLFCTYCERLGQPTLQSTRALVHLLGQMLPKLRNCEADLKSVFHRDPTPRPISFFESRDWMSTSRYFIVAT